MRQISFCVNFFFLFFALTSSIFASYLNKGVSIYSIDLRKKNCGLII
jgi:hypothetical protein